MVEKQLVVERKKIRRDNVERFEEEENKTNSNSMENYQRMWDRFAKNKKNREPHKNTQARTDGLKMFTLERTLKVIELRWEVDENPGISFYLFFYLSLLTTSRYSIKINKNKIE